MLRSRLRTAPAALAVALVLVIGGCAPATPTPTPPPTASPPSPSPSASPAPPSPTPTLPPPSPTAVPGPSEETLPPTTHDAPDLEALLPAQVGDQPLIRESARLDRTTGDDAGTVALRQFLAANGKTPADLVIASAYSTDITVGLYVAAFRAPGIDPVALRDVLIEIAVADGPVDKQETTVGGKPVLHVTDNPRGLSSYLYATSDTLFLVETLNAGLAAEILAGLP